MPVTTYTSAPFPSQWSDPNTNLLLSGGSIESRIKGTSTPQMMYSDELGTEIGTSVALNAGGMPEVSGAIVQIWLAIGVDYEFKLKDASGDTVFTVNYMALDASLIYDSGRSQPLSETLSGFDWDFLSVSDANLTFGSTHLNKWISMTPTAERTLTMNSSLGTQGDAIIIQNLASTTHNMVLVDGGENIEFNPSNTLTIEPGKTGAIVLREIDGSNYKWSVVGHVV